MAFLKYANAAVIRPGIFQDSWDQVRHDALAVGSAFTKQAAKKVFTEFSPDDYLLTHCTIVASVDTENGPGKLGRQLVDGIEIDRQYQDYYVTPKTSQWINNNFDAWERNLLLSSFPTFVGGYNFVEHLQVPEMSKGRIVDAVARDVKDSIYVDILVATHRKHRPLIAAIESKQLNTLSMGCTIQFSICTKCGNVAVDETQLCPHIKYQKGNTFTDELGQKRVIAELCGHVKAEPGSVKFVEGSWVGNPAFTGAVVRNILSPAESQKYANAIRVAFEKNPEFLQNVMQRAASRIGFDFGDEDEDEGGGASEDSGNPLDKGISDLEEHIVDKVVKKLKKNMEPAKEAVPTDSVSEEENLIKEASRSPKWRKAAGILVNKLGDAQVARRILAGVMLQQRDGWRALRVANFSGPEILAVDSALRLLNSRSRDAFDNRVSSVIMTVGGLKSHRNVNDFLQACCLKVGRKLTDEERKALVGKARLFDLGI